METIERLRAENARFRAVVEALRTQSCGAFGEFANMPLSTLRRLHWYLREFDKIGGDK